MVHIHNYTYREHYTNDTHTHTHKHHLIKSSLLYDSNLPNLINYFNSPDFVAFIFICTAACDGVYAFTIHFQAKPFIRFRCLHPSNWMCTSASKYIKSILYTQFRPPHLYICSATVLTARKPAYGNKQQRKSDERQKSDRLTTLTCHEIQLNFIS